MSKQEQPSGSFIEREISEGHVVTPTVRIAQARYDDIDQGGGDPEFHEAYDTQVRKLRSQRWGMQAILSFTQKADDFIGLEEI